MLPLLEENLEQAFERLIHRKTEHLAHQLCEIEFLFRYAAAKYILDMNDADTAI